MFFSFKVCQTENYIYFRIKYLKKAIAEEQQYFWLIPKIQRNSSLIQVKLNDYQLTVSLSNV